LDSRALTAMVLAHPAICTGHGARRECAAGHESHDVRWGRVAWVSGGMHFAQA
jgi:hypothetical protein